ncbi:MAG: hypothetical protein QXT63_06415, partial [Thermoplasmata archaeon]
VYSGVSYALANFKDGMREEGICILESAYERGKNLDIPEYISVIADMLHVLYCEVGDMEKSEKWKRLGRSAGLDGLGGV